MRARKRFGQHFLEPAWVTKLVAAIGPSETDDVLEIGPGRGAITAPLAKQVRRLLAVEVDRDLAAELKASAPAHVTVVTADVLAVDLADIATGWLGGPPGPERQFRVVGNLPYNISSPILFTLLEFAARTGGISDATLMLQKEVADRLVAKPGTGEYGVLTVFTALGADVRRVLSLPPGAFRPPPKVSSAVVRLSFRPPDVQFQDLAVFTAMVRTMFTQRRKILLNSLRAFGADRGVEAGQALAQAGIDPMRRPETLQLVEMARLADIFAAAKGPSAVL